MFNFLETKSVLISKIFFSNKEYCHHLYLKPNKPLIKTNQFKKIYINEINKICKKINDKYKIIPSLPEVSSLFFSFLQNLNGQWELFCENDFYQVGLCDRYPINQLILELETIITLVKLDGSKANILPIHINLRIHSNSIIHTHANVLLLDFKNKNLYLFEPKGNFNNFLNYLPTFSSSYKNIFTKIANKLQWKFNGYFLNDCNFQGLDNDTCYLWTSWFEIICLLNYMNDTKNIKKYFRNQYIEYRNYPFNYLISHYLLESHLKE